MTHLPPGTSKWNKIEHRLFAFITQNWRGKPLVSHQVIVQLIGATTTDTGLKVCCEIDGNLYPKGIKVTDAEMGESTSRATNSTASGTTPFLLTNNHLEAFISRQILSAVVCCSSVARSLLPCWFASPSGAALLGNHTS